MLLPNNQILCRLKECKKKNVLKPKIQILTSTTINTHMVCNSQKNTFYAQQKNIRKTLKSNFRNQCCTTSKKAHFIWTKENIRKTF